MNELPTIFSNNNKLSIPIHDRYKLVVLNDLNGNAFPIIVEDIIDGIYIHLRTVFRHMRKNNMIDDFSLHIRYLRCEVVIWRYSLEYPINFLEVIEHHIRFVHDENVDFSINSILDNYDVLRIEMI